MRGRHWFLVASLALGLAAFAAEAQDGPRTHYWPRRNLDFPVDPDQLSRLPDKPSELALFVSYNHSPFRQVAKYEPSRLPKVNGGRNGFPFEADRDGEYEFCVQFIYSDGRVNPRPDEMIGERRVVIDSTPPKIEIRAAGNGVEWNVEDENLDSQTITLECKFPSDSKWFAVQPVRSSAFQSADRYAWQLKSGQQLDVRLKARDRADNNSISRTVRVPAGGSLTSTGPTDPLMKRPDSEWPPRSPSTTPTRNDFTTPAPQARFEYVNSLEFNVDIHINHMGRSGVKAAHLFVSDDQRKWTKAPNSPFPVTKRPGDEDRPFPLSFRAPKEGLYGFIVIPESGAGKRAPDPAPDSPAMVLVEVDTTKPFAKIRSVEVLQGDHRGPRVEITWEAADPNLMPRPVSLEYALDKNAVQWQPIALQIENNLTKQTGRYSWFVPDEKLWRFYVRIRAVDRAANTAEHVYEQEVMVDLEKPGAEIKKVEGQNGGSVSSPSISVPRSTPSSTPTPSPVTTPPLVKPVDLDKPEVPSLP